MKNMKNIVKLFVLIAFVIFASCKENKAETNSTTTETASEELYSCPMHPEVTGKIDSACSICGMKLTEKVN